MLNEGFSAGTAWQPSLGQAENIRIHVIIITFIITATVYLYVSLMLPSPRTFKIQLYLFCLVERECSAIRKLGSCFTTRVCLVSNFTFPEISGSKLNVTGDQYCYQTACVLVDLGTDASLHLKEIASALHLKNIVLLSEESPATVGVRRR